KISAQITVLYTPEELVGRLVMAVVNFPPRQIGPVMSEVLVLGFSDSAGNISLAAPDPDVPIRGRLHYSAGRGDERCERGGRDRRRKRRDAVAARSFLAFQGA